MASFFDRVGNHVVNFTYQRDNPAPLAEGASMSRTIVIVDNERDERGNTQAVVSHGINEDTLEVVVLPAVHPAALGAHFDPGLAEYVVDDESPAPRG